MKIDNLLINEIILLLDEKKAWNVTALDMREISSTSDYFIIANGSNKPHLKALQESLLLFYKEKGLVKIIKTGTSESGWMIVDVDGIMVHLFDEELISITSLSTKNFSEKIKDIYIMKKQERINVIGKEENNTLEKKIFLQVIDFTWRSHLQYLEQLRQVIGLRSYGQKDPLSEFKKEAFVLFEGLLEKIKNDIIKFLLNLNIIVSNEKKEEQTQNISDKKKIGRNEKCPCGSGKKYKHCCGMI